MSLLNKIKSNLKRTASNNIGVQDSTYKAQRLIEAKSGRDIRGGSTPRISQQAELGQVQQARLGQEQLQEQAKVQTAQLSQQEQQLNEQQALAQRQVDTQRDSMQDRFQNQANAILNNISRNQRQVSYQRNAAQFEQAGILMRLSNNKYIHNLQMEGRYNRLDSAISFKEATARAIFDEELDMFNNNLEFQRMMDADSREFKELMQEIDIDFAMEMAEKQVKDKQSAAKWQAITGIPQTAASGYADYTSMTSGVSTDTGTSNAGGGGGGGTPAPNTPVNYN